MEGSSNRPALSVVTVAHGEPGDKCSLHYKCIVNGSVFWEDGLSVGKQKVCKTCLKFTAWYKTWSIVSCLLCGKNAKQMPTDVALTKLI